MIGYFDYGSKIRCVMNDDGTWSCEVKPILDLLNILYGPDKSIVGDHHMPFGVARLLEAADYFKRQAKILVPPMPPLPPGYVS